MCFEVAEIKSYVCLITSGFRHKPRKPCCEKLCQVSNRSGHFDFTLARPIDEVIIIIKLWNNIDKFIVRPLLQIVYILN